MSEFRFFSRDISWLRFNERVLAEATDERVPLLERIRFLSIFSSNLDEFYRVRMPVLHALERIHGTGSFNDGSAHSGLSEYEQASRIINQQQEQFGRILSEQLIPSLAENDIILCYNIPIPAEIRQQVSNFFYDTLCGLIEIKYITKAAGLFPENNKLYAVVALERAANNNYALLNIPSDVVPRFFTTVYGGKKYIVFIDDILRSHVQALFQDSVVGGIYNIKVTRDAELDLEDEYEGDIAEKIERQVNKRDMGLATRFLYPPDMPPALLELLIREFNLVNAGNMRGGHYHNLRDLFSFPVTKSTLEYPVMKAIPHSFTGPSIFSAIKSQDIWVHTPYESYNTILRFFNEAAVDQDVAEIFTTMYRVANDSKIAQALITAARNGKKVTVFVELKARFDESNNLKWGKRMKASGIRIVYSIPKLKVHAKIAMVKKRKGERQDYFGLFATGNLNEGTARFYTDHILLTAHREMLRELELVFLFLTRRKRPEGNKRISFAHLLVAQFNLKDAFIDLIDQEILNAKRRLNSGITIKINNLEEVSLISKLYEASQAGVEVRLIVRSICCLIPGVRGMSERISVRRIVDRYLEHGRVFVFNNNTDPKVYLGSSDWMNRNIYSRIEVCFPVYDRNLKKELLDLLDFQLRDDLAAVSLNESLNNVPLSQQTESIRSQEAIYRYCADAQVPTVNNNL